MSFYSPKSPKRQVHIFLSVLSDMFKIHFFAYLLSSFKFDFRTLTRLPISQTISLNALSKYNLTCRPDFGSRHNSEQFLVSFGSTCVFFGVQFPFENVFMAITAFSGICTSIIPRFMSTVAKRRCDSVIAICGLEIR